MHLVVEDAWEVQYPMLQSVFRESFARFYKCFEVEVNQPLWHLDLQFTLQEGVTHWRRFIFSTVEQVAATVEAHQGKCRLHVQSARADVSDSYELSPVDAIEIGKNSDGRTFHVVMVEECQLIYPKHEIGPGELRECRLIYCRESG